MEESCGFSTTVKQVSTNFRHVSLRNVGFYPSTVGVRGSWIIFLFQDVRPNQMSNFKSIIQPSKCVLPPFFSISQIPIPNPSIPLSQDTSPPFHGTIPFHKFSLDTVSNIWTNNMKPNVSLYHIYMQNIILTIYY